MDHPHNEFELTHYKVFRVNMPLYHKGPTRHHIYVETNDSLPSFRGFTGHKFQVIGVKSKPMIFAKIDCSQPFRSCKEAELLHVGWVLCNDFVDRVKEICRTVPPPSPDQPLRCCHEWTDAAIGALHAAGVLEEPRSFDNTEIVRYVATPEQAQQGRS